MEIGRESPIFCFISHIFVVTGIRKRIENY